jgi:hypothetical protein
MSALQSATMLAGRSDGERLGFIWNEFGNMVNMHDA